MKSYFLKFSATLTFLFILVIGMSLQAAAPAAGKPPTATPGGGGGGTTITVSGTQWGVSTCSIGANEGSHDFNTADMTDLGINTYRLYGGMSRWEPVDDDGVYGSPTKAQIQANINVIPWAVWDNIMTTPPGGTDYSWSDLPPQVWVGNARTIFSNLKTAGIKPVVVLRNKDNNALPAWFTGKPSTTQDWDEWWEHVVATVYWFNVRNDYRVDDWEVHNEPDAFSQGWAGKYTGYKQLVINTNDAIQWVYANYLPGRTPHVYAPVTTTGNSWPNNVITEVPNNFDTMDVHNYDMDITSFTRTVHGWMNAAGYPNRPLWITEWGDYPRNGSVPYSSVSFSVNNVVSNLIRSSRPGDDYWAGSHLFSLYDWGISYYPSGLIASDGTHRPGYYALRLGTRALQGCRATYQSTSNNTSLLAITTKDTLGKVYLLVANNGTSFLTVDANLSALITSGAGTLWQFDATHNDVINGSPVLSAGHVTFTIPGTAAILIKF